MIRVRVLILAITAALFGSIQIASVSSHEESGEWHCDSDHGIRIQAEFIPGVITVDGHAGDWKDIDGSDFPLLPALDPDADKEYNDGKMTLKAVHDGKEAYFMLQVNGNYAYAKGNDNSCPSVALMFQIGENASYHREMLYLEDSGRNPLDNREGNGGDRFGHLVDVYAWNPHCIFLDGISPSGNETSAQNDWQGSWWHSSLTDHSGLTENDSPYTSEGQKGTYFFEFSRSLRTMDRIQQDAQFTIGKSSKMSGAFWYPMEGKPWHGSGHFSISCDWIPLDFISSRSEPAQDPKVTQTSPWDAATAFSLLFSVVPFCMSIFIGHRLSRTSRTVPFTPMDNL